ncbi:MAG: hypothetical protein HY369_04220 [Candidatus Aenigmarchaeota archaeon]|nr:hypothetical protein [Candidatus Aenigmarchaeota archaeon]
MEIKCDCGYVAKGSDPHKVEAETWHHALKTHEDMLKKMGVEQLARVLKNNHQSLGLTK